MFVLKERNSKPTTNPPTKSTSNIVGTILELFVIWIMAPILIGFLAMLTLLYMFHDGPSKSLVPRVGGAQLDWVERTLIGNITSREYLLVQ